VIPIDLILNVAGLLLNLTGLLLWLNWSSFGSDPFAKGAPTTLAGTVRRAEPRRLKGWYLLLSLGALLFLRAVLYWVLGSKYNWTAHLHLNVISLAFRSDSLTRMLLFSVLSFGLVLAAVYVCLLLLSLVNGRATEADPLQKLVRLQLGPVDRWPWPVRLVAPLLVALPLWLGLSSLLIHQRILGLTPLRLRIEQGLVVGLGGYLPWTYLIASVLGLYILASYVYFGNHSFWAYIEVTGRNLIAPVRRLPLRLGKVDFAPLLLVAAVGLAGRFGGAGLTWLYARLPL
jgi:uncharacterized protein YggT (Ycf19 family)